MPPDLSALNAASSSFCARLPRSCDNTEGQHHISVSHAIITHFQESSCALFAPNLASLATTLILSNGASPMRFLLGWSGPHNTPLFSCTLVLKSRIPTTTRDQFNHFHIWLKAKNASVLTAYDCGRVRHRAPGGLLHFALA